MRTDDEYYVEVYPPSLTGSCQWRVLKLPELPPLGGGFAPTMDQAEEKARQFIIAHQRIGREAQQRARRVRRFVVRTDSAPKGDKLKRNNKYTRRKISTLERRIAHLETRGGSAESESFDEAEMGALKWAIPILRQWMAAEEYDTRTPKEQLYVKPQRSRSA